MGYHSLITEGLGRYINLALAAVSEAEDFSTKSEYIKDVVEEADLEDVAETDMAVAMEEEEIVGAVDKMLERCNAISDYNWRFTRHITSLTMNWTGYLRHKE